MDGDGSQQFTETVVTAVECASIDSGITLINSYISKQVNLAHAKIIVISETLAQEGIFNYIATFVNNVEVRPDCNIIISRCSAEDFLNNSKPDLEILSARYYEQVLSSYQYTGYSGNTTLISFFSAYKSQSCEPVAILGGINSPATHKINTLEAYVDMDSGYKADETPIKNETNLEIIGLAVFNKDKLVGELTGMDSMCYLMCTNQFDSSSLTIPSPFNENQIVDLAIAEDKKTETAVSIVNGSPYIKVKVNIMATVSSMENGQDLTKEENLALLEDYASSYLKEKLLSYLDKTAKEFHADIANFGETLSSRYLTIDEWEKLNWSQLYSDSTFDVEVSMRVKNSYLLVKD